ncbi:MAG: DNA-3-methyladenine glycosylase I [Candidatus Eremiobacterales bacterium]
MRQVADKPRCAWAAGDPEMVAYHDKEWGTPIHDDRVLFEFLILEGAQAGLSWSTILHKRAAYRRAFAGFDPRRVARFDATKVRSLIQDPGIVRNRLKIAGAVRNARAFLAIAKEHGSFDKWVWSFVRGKPIVRRGKRNVDNPSTTPESDALSKALKQAGFTFVGSTICYAFMQAVGLVDDHIATCFRAKRRR